MNTDKMIPIDFSRNITPFVVGDKLINENGSTETISNVRSWNHRDGADSGWFVISFVDRPNTGKQPVDDDVVVDVILASGNPPSNNERRVAGGFVWSIWKKSSDIKTWKLNHAELLAKFKSEQGAKQMNYLEQETELATHYSANNNCFYIQESHIECFAMVLDDVGRWIYSDCTTNEELNGDEFFALDADQDNHKEDAHHVAIQTEEVGNQPLNHIDLAIGAGAVDDIVISPDEPVLAEDLVIEDWVIDHLTDKPVFTQGELPEIGWVGEVCHDLSEMISTLRHWKIGDQIRCIAHVKNTLCKDTAVFQHLFLTTVSGLSSDCYQPIDNRTDSERLKDAMTSEMVTDEEFQEVFNMAEDWAIKLMDSDKFTITLKD